MTYNIILPMLCKLVDASYFNYFDIPDEIQQVCCQRACYTSKHCKDAVSVQCNTGDYDCAIGSYYTAHIM